MTTNMLAINSNKLAFTGASPPPPPGICLRLPSPITSAVAMEKTARLQAYYRQPIDMNSPGSAIAVWSRAAKEYSLILNELQGESWHALRMWMTM
jgi:hypothetical protein